MGNRQDRKSFEMRLKEMVDTLRSEIEQGIYPPGAYLPSEIALAKRFQLSGKSISKGLDHLEAEQRIIRKHRVGNMVVSGTDGNQTTIHFAVQYSAYQDAMLVELLEDFAKQHPQFKVNVIQYEPANHESIVEFAQTEQIDVLMLNYKNFFDMTMQNEESALEPVDIREDTYRFLHKGFSHDGVCYVQPLCFAPVVICYNRKHFKEAGVQEPDSDWTWKNLFDKAKRLSEQTDKYGFYFHYLSDNRWPIFLLQQHVRFEQQESGKYRFNLRLVMDTFTFLRDWMQESRAFAPFFSENSTDVSHLFAQEKVSMAMISYWAMNDLKDSAIDYDIAPLPFFQDPATLLLCLGLAVCKESKEKEAARLLVNYLISEEAQRKIREYTLSLPAMKRVAESKSGDTMNCPSRFGLYREIIPSYRLHQDLGLSPDASLKIRRSLKLFWPRLESAEEMRARLEELM